MFMPGTFWTKKILDQNEKPNVNDLCSVQFCQLLKIENASRPDKDKLSSSVWGTYSAPPDP